MVKDKLFRFLWKNKRAKIKHVSVYQDYCEGGLRMVDTGMDDSGRGVQETTSSNFKGTF